MVAYSFNPRFVEPIRVGLGYKLVMGDVAPKRQTIRAHKKGRGRHAQPGEELQLYCGMRTRQCFLIGKARCIDVQLIFIVVEAPLIRIGPGIGRSYQRVSELDEFARGDGFADWREMALFWYEHHHADMNDFHGVIIKWEPLEPAT